MSQKAPSRKIQVPDKRLSSKSEKLSLADLQSQISAWSLGRVFLGEPSNTSKALDKCVVVRVILHGQCSLQRKEAI